MKTAALRIFAIGVGVVLLTSAYTRMHSASVMTDAAKAFLASLTPQQRAQATFQFQSDERFNWHYIPKERKGLALREMTAEQKQLAHALLAAGLSQQGYIKAVSIMSLDQVLKILEAGKGPHARSGGLFLHRVRRAFRHRHLGLSRGRASLQPELHHRQWQGARRAELLWNQPGRDPRRSAQGSAHSGARGGPWPPAGEVVHGRSKENRRRSARMRRKRFSPKRRAKPRSTARRAV